VNAPSSRPSPRPTRPAPAPAVARLAPASLALLGLLAACTDKPASVTPSDTVSAERFDALEREFRAMKEERDSLLHGAAVSSSEALALAASLKEVSTRQAELEAKLAALSAAGAPSAPGATGAGASTTPGTPLPPVVGIPIPPDSTQPFTEDQLSAFRRMSDEVDKRKAAEQQARRLKDDLTRAGVSLTPEQEAQLGKLQASFVDKIRELYRGGGGASEADRQALVAQRDALRAQYENDIRSIVPAADADKIVEAMNRGGGFSRRNSLPGQPGGMGGMGG